VTITNKTIVLDLDDTLYSEIDYLKSGYRYIASKISNNPANLYGIMLEKYELGENVFDYLETELNISKSSLLDYYRFHKPNIELYEGVMDFLNKLSQSYKFSIVTDGRSRTQRNKIQALGLEPFLSNIVISEEIGSEKPNITNFQKAVVGLNSKQNFYIGDNIKKDFITPNKMGWTTICLKDAGQNIHKQDFYFTDEYLPNYCFNSWSEIYSFFNSQC